MDYSKLTDQDLLALKSGDYSKLSNEGLLALKGESQPAPEPAAPIGQQLAEVSSPQNLIETMAPSNVLPAAAVAGRAAMGATGLNPSLVSPIADTGKVLDAAMNPIAAAKDVMGGMKRGVEALVDKGFKPTEQEKNVHSMGKWAGLAMEMGGMPAAKPGKGGMVDKAAETLDTLAGVPQGSSFALIRNPSKWISIFTSRAGVKNAYKKAIDAGEAVAEDASQATFNGLLDSATSGTTKTIKDLAKAAAPMVEGGSPVHTPTLTTFRKSLNDEIGRLKTVIEAGLRSEKSQNVAVRRLVNYQEMAKRVNKVLDKTAPKFREADKVMADSMQMKGFRSGLKPFAFGTAEALGSGIAQQGLRALPAGQMINQGFERLKNKSKKRD